WLSRALREPGKHGPFLSRLCVSCDGDPGTQHSFPTRRSSDLIRGSRSKTSRPAPPMVPNHSACASACSSTTSPRAVLMRKAPGRDRKSTRLNSSHVKISYAVFCLKKKRQHMHAVDVTSARRQA